MTRKKIIHEEQQIACPHCEKQIILELCAEAKLEPTTIESDEQPYPTIHVWIEKIKTLE